MTMLFCAFAPHERARLGTFIIVPTALMPALGPVLGGFLAEHGDWPWLFLVNVPLGIVTLALGVVGLRDGERAPAERFDAGGFVLAALGLGLLVLGSGLGTTRGWSDPLVLAGLVIGGLGTVSLVIHQLRRTHPCCTSGSITTARTPARARSPHSARPASWGCSSSSRCSCSRTPDAARSRPG